MTTANRERTGQGAPHNFGFADVFGGWLWGGEAAFAGDEVEHRAHLCEAAEAGAPRFTYRLPSPLPPEMRIASDGVPAGTVTIKFIWLPDAPERLGPGRG